ncbi:MAG: hypothetical protein M0Z69_03315, partial [Actinomycetota bacterium]|nr:hypothetical protein [Actinomycetota bacterium]
RVATPASWPVVPNLLTVLPAPAVHLGANFAFPPRRRMLSAGRRRGAACRNGCFRARVPQKLQA